MKDLFIFYFWGGGVAVPDTPPVVQVPGPRRVVLVQGQRLALSCITTNVNGDIKLKWSAPPGSVRTSPPPITRLRAPGGRGHQLEPLGDWLRRKSLGPDSRVFLSLRRPVGLRLVSQKPAAGSCM